MSLKRIYIKAFFRHFMIVMMLFAMGIQPITQMLALVTDFTYELVEVDSEEDTDKEEKQEDDHKDNKLKLQIVSPFDHSHYSIAVSNDTNNSLICYGFDMEIPIPPPDVV
ncbi:hypothetical protein [Aquimarina sediminis]|uniref:hypothetical protein n=1 Tax=Aquimarina sediminis TaxID=2070536 RepID=UPI000FFE4E8D|nr:hypothetical protein [Aquimarina sediminis]